MNHTDISDKLLHLSVGSNADEQLELAISGVQPQSTDQHGQNDSTHRIDPPTQLTTTDGGQNTEPVNKQIVAVILPQDADLRDLVAQGPAVQEKDKFGGKGDGDGNDSREVERLGSFLGARYQFANGEGDDDERNGGHKEAEADVASGLDAGLSSRELARIDAIDGLVAEQEGQIGHGVEDRVGHCGEERERSGRDGTVHLDDRENDIRGKTTVNSNPVLETVVDAQFAGGTSVLLHGLQHALDVFILGLVEAL